MKHKSIIVSTVAAFIVGGGIGAASATPEAAPAAAPAQTEVKTETVEVEVEVTPQACLDAIAAAENVGGDSADFSEIASELPMLVPRAAEAGMNMDAGELGAITADLEAFTAEVDTISISLSGHVEDFNSAKAECRASAD